MKIMVNAKIQKKAIFLLKWGDLLILIYMVICNFWYKKWIANQDQKLNQE